MRTKIGRLGPWTSGSPGRRDDWALDVALQLVLPAGTPVDAPAGTVRPVVDDDWELRHAVIHARTHGAGPILIGAEVDDTSEHLYARFGFRLVAVPRSYARVASTSS